MTAVRVGVAGATGIVGRTVVRLLDERQFPVAQLRLFGSERSAGRRVGWRGDELTVEALDAAALEGLDLVVSAVSGELAKEWVPRMVESGAVVVDNSSAFRQNPDVPLVIPEINAHSLAGHRGIVANPNCTAAAVLMAAAPLHRHAALRALMTSSYQSVSGTGAAAMNELLDQTGKAVEQPEALEGREALDLPPPQVYPHTIAFNVLPQCETFPADGDTSTEELKMQLEARKILGLPDLVVHATAVRVPVMVGHSVAVSVSLERAVPPAEAREVIGAFSGATVVDRPDRAEYPTPLQAAGRDDVLVGRIRRNPALPNGLSLFVCCDNLRKGAALNAVQIAERLFG